MADLVLALDAVTTTGGFLLVLALILPVGAVLLAFVAGGRHVERVAFATMPLGFAIAVAILLGSKLIWWATERAWGKFSPPDRVHERGH